MSIPSGVGAGLGIAVAGVGTAVAIKAMKKAGNLTQKPAKKRKRR